MFKGSTITKGLKFVKFREKTAKFKTLRPCASSTTKKCMYKTNIFAPYKLPL